MFNGSIDQKDTAQTLAPSAEIIDVMRPPWIDEKDDAQPLTSSAAAEIIGCIEAASMFNESIDEKDDAQALASSAEIIGEYFCLPTSKIIRGGHF